MLRPPLLLLIIPGWAWGFFSPVHISRLATSPGAGNLSSVHASCTNTRFSERAEFRGTSHSRQAVSSHALRCHPLFKKGFGKGGLGKQGELMELMAKAQQDRAKKELEDKLRESGDLPEENSKPVKPKGGKIKAERSWRDAGAGASATIPAGPTAQAAAAAPVANPGAASSAQAPATGDTGANQKVASERKVVDPGGIGSRVWASTKIEGRPNDIYFEYDELLESTQHHGGTRSSPRLENPRASYLEYDRLRDEAQWDAIVAGETSVANRSPVASQSEYDAFEDMLTHGTPSTSQGGGGVVAPKVLEKKIQEDMNKSQVTQAFTAGEFAPLDPWRALSDADGTKVNFGLYRGSKPLLVVADARPGSSELREAMNELNARMPRKLVDVVAVTADSPGSNRKAVKKSRLAFPVLSDDDEGSWMLAYQLKSPTRFFEQTAFLIEPDLGTIIKVWSDFNAASLVDLVKDFLTKSS